MPSLSLTFLSWLNSIGLCCFLSRHHTSDCMALISPKLSVSRGDTKTRPQAKTIKSNHQIGHGSEAEDNPSDGKFPLFRSIWDLSETIFLCMHGVLFWQPEPRTRQMRACGRQSKPLWRLSWTSYDLPAVVMLSGINSFGFHKTHWHGMHSHRTFGNIILFTTYMECLSA